MSQIVTVMRKEKLRRRRLQHDSDPRQRAEDALDKEAVDPRESLRDPLADLRLQPSPDDPGAGSGPGEGPVDPLKAAALRDDLGGSSSPDGDPGDGHPGLPSGGHGLPQLLLEAFERVFNRPLDHVVLHEGGDAAARADAIDAEAYTVGNHIVLGGGVRGLALERLLAHELTHVVQADEGRMPTTGPTVVDARHPLEGEAYRNEDRVVRELQQAKREVRGSSGGAREASVEDDRRGRTRGGETGADARGRLQASLPGVISLVDAVLSVWTDVGSDDNGEVDDLGRELRGLLGELASGLQGWADPLLSQAADPSTTFAWAEALVAELATALPQLQPLMAAIAETSLLDVILGGSRAFGGALAEGDWQLPEQVLQLAATAGSSTIFDDDPQRAAQTEQILQQMARALGPDVANVEVHADALGKQRASQKGAMGLMEQGVVYLDPALYDPDTCQGIELLAHEIAHVVQAGNPVVNEGDAGARAESEADQWAASFAAGEASTGLQEGLPTGHVAAKTKGAETAVTDTVDPDETAKATIMLEKGEADCDCGPNPWDGVHESDDENAEQVDTVQEDGEEGEVNQGEVDTEQEEEANVEPGEEAEEDAEAGAAEVDAMAAEVEALPEDVPEKPESAEELASRIATARTLLASAGNASLIAGLTPVLTAPAFESLGDEQADLAAKAEADQRREQSQTLLSQFMAERGDQVAAFVAISATIDQRMEAAAAAAVQLVQTQIEAQKAAVSAHVSAMRDRASAEAETLRAVINGAHDTTVNSARAVTDGGKQWANAVLTGLLGEMDGMLSTQKSTIDSLYTKNDGLYRAAGKSAGDFAIKEGGTMAADYRSKKIKRADSILDGDLTDRRCEARAKAAEAVSKAYSEELIKKANEQADKAMLSKPRDVEAAVKLHAEATGQLKQMHEGVTKQLETQLTGTLAATEQSRAALLTAVDTSLSGAIQTLDDHETQQIAKLDETGAQIVQGIHQQRDFATLGYQELAANTAKGLIDAFTAMGASMQGVGAPDPKELSKALGDAGSKIDAKLAQVTDYITAGLDTAAGALAETGSKGVDALGQIGQNAIDKATSAVDSLSEAFSEVGNAAWTASSEIATNHSTLMQTTMTDAVTGFNGVRDGLKKGYDDFNKSLQEGAESNSKAMEEGLRKVVTEKMGEKIRKDAEEAAAKEQPAWKTVVKWLLIIAVIVVCAFVLGPLLIGAMVGLAKVVFASALVATVVGTMVAGAIIGAASGAVVQVINNWAAGDDILKDVWTSTWKGAIGGAVGGAVGTAIGPAALGLGKVASYAISVSADVIVDALLSVATGTFSWEGLATTALTSIITNGASNYVPSVGARQAAATDAVNFKLGGTPTVDANVSGIDVNAPKVDANVSPVDVNAPVVDVNAPVVDVNAPTVDVNAPKVDASAPTVDANAPKVDTSAPTVDANAPKVDTSAPVVDANAPKVDANAPTVDANAPKVDANAPTVDANAPKVDANAPVVDANAPKVDPNAPVVQPPKRAPHHRSGMADSWFDPSTGDIRWPPNDGFSGSPKAEVLQPGMRIDRYSGRTGSADSGSFFSPEGAAFDARALPYEQGKMKYAVYEVVKPIPAEGGAAAPWFDLPGGAIQLKTKMSVSELLAQGYIIQVQ